MSLNLHLAGDGLVLRVHQPWESRARITALRQLRRRLRDTGLRVASPVPVGGRDLVRWEGRWAELEAYVTHSKPPPTWDSYLWMYEAMGTLHMSLRQLSEIPLPRPAIATYGPPDTLRRWMAVTAHAVEQDLEGRAIARWSRELIGRLARTWTPARTLPVQIVHGDIRLGNVVHTPDGEPVYLDFGFAARRPRVHELAYSLSWIILRPDGSGTGEDFDWDRLRELLGAYERTAYDRLTGVERSSLGPFIAAVPLYMAAIAGFTLDPVAHLLENERFIRIADWVLSHPPPSR